MPNGSQFRLGADYKKVQPKLHVMPTANRTSTRSLPDERQSGAGPVISGGGIR